MSNTEVETWWAEIDGSGKYMVAGGGLGNGNAYANIEEDNGNWWYVEYGKNPSRRYLGNKFVWVEKRKGCPNEGSFKIETDMFKSDSEDEDEDEESSESEDEENTHINKMDYKQMYEQMKEENKKLKAEIVEQKELDEWVYGELRKEKDEWVNKLNIEINKVIKLEGENKELKEEMKWRMWGENMKGADYDIENDEDAWDCVVMEHGFTETEMKQLLKYYPRPVLSDSDTEDEVRGVCYSCEKEGKFIGKEGDDWLCEECC